MMLDWLDESDVAGRIRAAVERAPEPAEGSWLAPGWAYFAHSYALTGPVDGWRPAWTDHGGRFVSALGRGRVLACQFHPQLSGPWGESLLLRWLAGGEA